MLLIAIAIKIEVFKGLSTCVVFKTIVSIMKNSYVSSILCSILAVLIIYITQVYHSKKQRYTDYKIRRKESGPLVQGSNLMRREFGDTYWWYFDYQN